MPTIAAAVRTTRAQNTGHLDDHRRHEEPDGISVRPLNLLPGHNVCEVFFDDVGAVANRVGEENGGWNLITNQLNHERVTLCSPGMIENHLDEVKEWANQQFTTTAAGSSTTNGAHRLARLYARLEFLRLINWKVAYNATQHTLHPADASATKTFAPSSISRRCGA